MKHEQCKNCTKSTFQEKFRLLPGFLGLLFGLYKSYENHVIYCTNSHKNINPEDYYLICNLGCGSFDDNNHTKKV